MTRLPLLLALPLCLMSLPVLADDAVTPAAPAAATPDTAPATVTPAAPTDGTAPATPADTTTPAAPAPAGDTTNPATPADTTPSADGALYKFVAHQEDALTGTMVTVQFVYAGGESETVIEIPYGTKDFDQMARAQTIANRLFKASLADKGFWNQLKPGMKNRQIVLALDDTYKGYVMTADKKSATLLGVTQQQYAAVLLSSIRTALMGKLREAKFDYQLTGEEVIERANIYRRQGNAALAEKDDTRAESQYKQAIAVAPAYAVPYLALGNFYLAKGDTADARLIFKQALSRGLDLVALNDTLNPEGTSAGLTQAIALFKKVKAGS